MTSGLQVWNDGGLFQIDGSFPNMHLRSLQSGTAAYQSIFIGNNPGGAFNGILPVVDFYMAAGTPVFALYSPGAPAVIKKTETDNAGNWHVQVLCASVGQVVDLLCFDSAQASSNSAGFQVFNESGVCVFDATAPPLVITDAKSGNIAGVAASAHTYNTTVTYTPNVIFPTTPGRKYAVVGAMGVSLGFYPGTVANGQLNTYLYPGMFQTDNGQIQMPLGVFGLTPNPAQGQVQYSTTGLTVNNQTTAYGSCFGYQFLIADVTGIV